MKQKSKYGNRESFFTNFHFAFISDNISLPFPLSILSSTFHAGFRLYMPSRRIWAPQWPCPGRFFPRFALFLFPRERWIYRKKQQYKLDSQKVIPTNHWDNFRIHVSLKEKASWFPIAPFFIEAKIQIF